jgi:two-component system, OmpR family, sensor histidine kinase MtrB
MRLDTLFRWMAAGILLLTLAASAAMLTTSTYFHLRLVDVVQRTEAVYLAGDLLTSLLVHNGATRRYLASRQDEHLAQLNAAVQEIDATLAGSRELDRRTGGGQGELVERTAQSIGEYLRRCAELRAAHRPDIDLEAFTEYAEAVRGARALRQVRLREAQAAGQQSTDWNRRTRVAVAGLTVALIAAGLALIWLLRAGLLRPLAELRGGLLRARADVAAPPLRERGVRELREVASALNERNELIGRQRQQQLAFLAGVAHDLKNPLAALKIASSSLLKREDLSRDAARAALTTVGRQVDRLARMLNDLLDATRIEAGEFDYQMQEVDVRELLRETHDLFGQASEHHPLQLSVSAEPLWIRCDPARLTQVLNNLVSNAIKYCPEGGPVSLSAEAQGAEVVLAVADHGGGISAEDLPHIFEPFRRGKVGASIPGVGLGLSVAQRIVLAHRGRLEVESTVGVGSTFRIWLPRLPH